MRERMTVSGKFTTHPNAYSTTTYACNGTIQNTNSYSSLSGTQVVKLTKDLVRPRPLARKEPYFLRVDAPFSVSTESESRSMIGWNLTSPQKPGCQGPYSYREQGSTWFALPPTLVVPEPTSAQIAAAVNGAISKARQGTWDFLTFAGEFKSTSAMFRKAAFALHKSVRAAIKKAQDSRKRGGKSLEDITPAEWLDMVSSAWLTYRYGIMPLVYDLQDMREALKKGFVSDLLRERSTVTLSDTLNKTRTTTDSSRQYVVVETLSYTHKVRGWAGAFVPYQSAIAVDPIRTAYELTTLSFVMDWFFDFGTWLEAVSPFAVGELLGSTASVQTVSSYTQEVSWTGINGFVGSASAVTWTKDTKKYARWPQGATLPGYFPRLNAARVTDAVALVYSISRTLFRSR